MDHGLIGYSSISKVANPSCGKLSRDFFVFALVPAGA